MPLYEDEFSAASEEIVIDEQHAGYDGLPVTRRVEPVFESVESEYQAGYDGLPLMETESRRSLSAIEE